MALHTLSILPVAGLALALSATAQDKDNRPVLVQAARLWIAPGEVLDGADARLLIRDGKIAGVGRAIPADGVARARRVEFDGATISAGIVLVHDLLGQAADLSETIDPFTPDLSAADAFDPFGEQLGERSRSGVTCVVFAPSSANTFGGIACAVKRHVDAGVIAAPDVYLKVSLVAESLTDDRYPTSRMGAADLIRESFMMAQSPLGTRSPALDAIRTVIDGSRRIAIHARNHAEITTALELSGELGLQPLLLECGDLQDASIERLRETGGSVALAPIGFDSTDEQLALPARLAKAGIRFSFVARDGRQMRVAAALAVRNGVDRATALASLTRVPAEQAGLGERIGALRVGRDADFVVLTGDLVDLSSRLVQVWVDGNAVYQAPRPNAAGEPTPEASR